MVDSVTAPDNYTVVFKLKYPSGAFIPALAAPYNFIYQKARLDEDQHWYEKNIDGTGAFRFAEREAGAVIKGVKNPDFFISGRPYLDGFEAIFARKQSLRVQAIRGDRAAIEFRGFPPKSRDDLVKALGKDITVQESDRITSYNVCYTKLLRLAREQQEGGGGSAGRLHEGQHRGHQGQDREVPDLRIR